jgi:predicted nucleic acid-binding protein
MIVLIDSGVLGKICSPNPSDEVNAVKDWMYSLLAKGVVMFTSQICDYEIRRSLILNSIRGLSSEGIDNLDRLSEIIDFLPISQTVLKTASQIWAEARNQGIPTADEKSLDADVIICAQWQLLTEEYPGRYVVIATTNVKHLSRFTQARLWQDIIF